MIKLYKICVSLFFLFGFTNLTLAKESFFTEGVKLFDAKKYDDAKFLFERSIVFEPKHAKSYLYLAKIYKEKNLWYDEVNNKIDLPGIDEENNRKWFETSSPITSDKIVKYEDTISSVNLKNKAPSFEP